MFSFFVGSFSHFKLFFHDSGENGEGAGEMRKEKKTKNYNVQDSWFWIFKTGCQFQYNKSVCSVGNHFFFLPFVSLFHTEHLLVLPWAVGLYPCIVTLEIIHIPRITGCYWIYVSDYTYFIECVYCLNCVALQVPRWLPAEKGGTKRKTKKKYSLYLLILAYFQSKNWNSEINQNWPDKRK